MTDPHHAAKRRGISRGVLLCALEWPDPDPRLQAGIRNNPFLPDR